MNDNTGDALSIAISIIIFASAMTLIFFALQTLRGYNDESVGLVNEKQSVATTGGNSLAERNAGAQDDILTSRQVFDMILSSSEDVEIYVNGTRLDRDKIERAKDGVTSSVNDINTVLSASSNYYMTTTFDTNGQNDYVATITFTGV